MQTQEYEPMTDIIMIDNQEDEKNEPCCEEEEWVNDIDLPIATRKGVRSCMRNSKYPILDYVEYTKLLGNFKTFVAKIDVIHVPRNVQEAF